jgi:hypothetical protein
MEEARATAHQRELIGIACFRHKELKVKASGVGTELTLDKNEEVMQEWRFPGLLSL